MNTLAFILIAALAFLLMIAGLQVERCEKRIDRLESQVAELQKAIAAKQ